MPVEFDFREPPPQVQTLSEAQALINSLWALCGALTAEVTALRAQVAELQGQVATLKEQVALNSRNSSKPPSQDGPGSSPAPKKPPSGRKRGAQKGHRGHHRELLALEQVDEIIACHPATTVCCCGHSLPTPSLPKRRHQVVELPVFKATVTEYQLFDTQCPHCGQLHEAPLPNGVPTGDWGARLLGHIGLLSSRYRLSLRLTQEFLAEQYGIAISLGAVSVAQGQIAQALAPATEELREAVKNAPALHLDETGRRRAGLRQWLWTAVTTTFVVFFAQCSRAGAEVRTLLGESFSGIVISDRYSAYAQLPLAQRQICWAHLLRDFERMAERLLDPGKVGRRLRAYGYLLFRWYHRYRAGELPEAVYQKRMRWLRQRVRRQLERGTRLFHPQSRGTCKAILRVEPALWTFLDHPDVPPTNNPAEQALRPFVIWRKLSLHTQSDRGDHFLERILTVVETCRRQHRSVTEFLYAAIDAHLRADTSPSLLLPPTVKTPA